MNKRSAMRARTWRETKRKLLTRQSQIPSGPKSATNEFGSAVAVATCKKSKVRMGYSPNYVKYLSNKTLSEILHNASNFQL